MVVVAVAVWYIMGMAPAAFISGTATFGPGTDNVTFTPDARMAPSPILAADWRYSVLTPAGTPRYPAVGWIRGDNVAVLIVRRSLVIGELTTMPATGVVIGDTLRIQYRERDFWDFTIRAG
jgi:hypothetical protein